MDGESRRENSKRASGGLEAPACVQVYVWVFMVTFSVSPTLCLLLVHDGIELGNGLESLVIIGLIQAALAGLRFGKLVIWLHKQRLRSDGHS
jgi:hypothetical protein